MIYLKTPTQVVNSVELLFVQIVLQILQLSSTNVPQDAKNFKKDHFLEPFFNNLNNPTFVVKIKAAVKFTIIIKLHMMKSVYIEFSSVNYAASSSPILN